MFNWIDWVIVAVLAYYALQGWETGFADLGLNFVSFLISLILAVKFHQPVGNFLTEKFGVPEMWTSVLGYIIVGFIAEGILSQIAQLVILKVPKKLISSKWNKLLGIGISIFNGIVVIAFFLLVIMALPLRGTIKH